MAKCNHDGCSRDVYTQGATAYEHCVLHVPKHDWSDDTQRQAIIQPFYDALLEDILDKLKYQLDKKIKVHSKLSKEDFKEFLKGKENDTLGHYHTICDTNCTLNDIHFPKDDGGQSIRFTGPSHIKLLEKIKAIEFVNCTFNNMYWSLPKTQVLYDECEFKCKWFINATDKVIIGEDKRGGVGKSKQGDDADFLFRDCKFFDEVSAEKSSEDKENTILNLSDEAPEKGVNLLFLRCSFHKKIRFENVVFNIRIFEGCEAKLKEIEFKDCVVNERFSLNNQKNITKFVATNTDFKSKFEFKNNTVKKTSVYDCNFEKLADFYSTKFSESFVIEKSIFGKFVVFESCEFGIEQGLLSSNFLKNNPLTVTTFKAVTFEDFANFRDTKFHNGLDIEKINLSKDVNFLHAEIELWSSKQETFRIIKNSFDKVGNYPEANRFFSYEMKKLLKETPWERFGQKIVLYFNYFVSNFGQSYLLPMYWLLGSLVCFIQIKIEHKGAGIGGLSNEGAEGWAHSLNEIGKNIPLFRFVKAEKGLEAISLFFYLLFSILIWQIIVAVKRNTKR